jgi:class 3 adenylate cyclase/tetratricopeptide (TPR) repeat protein
MKFEADPVAAVERRYLTIVFSDLSGFTGLSEQLDPEDLRDVRNKYQRLALEIVERYGGFVSSFSGDGILIYFGYPAAHENDAERAVRAALELVHSVPKIQLDVVDFPDLRLSVRVGLHTGLVLMAPEMASSGILEHAVVGQAVNLASRLQEMAEPNAVVASKDTFELVEGLFESRSLGIRTVKGFSQPVAVHQITRLKQNTRTSGVRFRRGGTRMIGRAAALDAIRHEWASVLGESGSCVLFVTGEAGLGKTRLVMEFQRHAELQAGSIVQLTCHELFAGTPLYPVAGVLWEGAGLGRDDTDDVRISKLRGFLEGFGLGTAENVETATSLLETYGVPQPRTPGLAQADIKKRQFGFLQALLQEKMNRGPQLLWIEDAHWLDPSSAELLTGLIPRMTDAPLLLLVTMRPQSKPLSLPKPDEIIQLAPLSASECLELAYSVPGARSLPTELLNHAVSLADGSPLFVEQLTLSLIDGQGRPALKGRGTDVLPLTLAEMISERLDRLPGTRRIVQVSACLGRSFTPEFLQRLLDDHQSDLGEILDQLVKAEILRLQDGNDEPRYEFRHALLQRAAYDLMVPSTRRATHARVAATLAAGDSGPVVPEVLAHHLTAAAQHKEAASAWLQAAVAAARRSAYVEAIADIERGLALVDKITDAEARRALELGLQAASIGPYTVTSGPTSQKLLACCQRGLHLCGQGPQSPLVFAFLFGQFSHAICCANTSLALSSADLFLKAAQNAKYDSGEVIGHRLVGMARLGKGTIGKSIEALETALKAYRPDRDDAATLMFGQNPKVHICSLLSFALIHAGRVDEALSIGSETLQSLDDLQHPHSSALALGYVGGWVFGLCGFTEQLMFASRRLVALTEQHGLHNMRVFGQVFIGWALCQAGDLPQGIAVLEQAVSDMESSGWRLTLPGHMAVLADALRRARRYSEASEVCDRALKIIAEGGERLHEPEARRVQAMIEADRAGRVDTSTAELFRAALDCALALDSAFLQFRALTTLRDYLGAEALDERSTRRLAELSYLADLKSPSRQADGQPRSAAAT